MINFDADLICEECRKMWGNPFKCVDFEKLCSKCSDQLKNIDDHWKCPECDQLCVREQIHSCKNTHRWIGCDRLDRPIKD